MTATTQTGSAATDTAVPTGTAAPTDTAAPTGTEAFIQAFRAHPGGVVVITALGPDGSPVGFTATSLASLSASPARATFNIIRSASSYPAVVPGAKLAVHFLAEGSRDIAQRYASEVSQRFAGEHWHPEEDGLPVIDEASGILFTTVHQVFPLDDNAVVVLDIETGRFAAAGDPLLYVNRTFGRVAPLPEYNI